MGLREENSFPDSNDCDHRLIMVNYDYPGLDFVHKNVPREPTSRNSETTCFRIEQSIMPPILGLTPRCVLFTKLKSSKTQLEQKSKHRHLFVKFMQFVPSSQNRKPNIRNQFFAIIIMLLSSLYFRTTVVLLVLVNTIRADGCCSMNYKDCDVSWCGSTKRSCENCGGNAFIFLEDGAIGGRCLKRCKWG